MNSINEILITLALVLLVMTWMFSGEITTFKNLWIPNREKITATGLMLAVMSLFLFVALAKGH